MSLRTEGRKCLAVILAAGEGTRMRSAKPKVLHAIAGRPMLAHVIDALERAGAESVSVVIGPGRDDVAALVRRCAPEARVYVQQERRGTAHAALAARAALMDGADDVVIAFGDTPLVTPARFAALREALAEGAAVAVLAFEAADPTGYGRLLRAPDGALVGVREEKDATAAERAIVLCNAGVMAIAGDSALALLESVSAHNAQSEYYLTDLIALARANGLQAVYRLAPEEEVMGVNDRVQLAAAEQAAQARLRAAAMRAGVTFLNPTSVYLSHDVELGVDVTIEPNVVIGQGVVVGDGAVVGAFSRLERVGVPAGAVVPAFSRLGPQ